MRILRCGDNEYYGECIHCGCAFAYDESEISKDIRPDGHGNGQEFVICPQCHYAITYCLRKELKNNEKD